MEKWKPPTQKDIDSIKHMKVDYKSVSEMPEHKRNKLKFAIDWIVEHFNPPYIDLVMSQLCGWPIDEYTPEKDILLKRKVFGKTKFSDWDFIVPTLPENQIIKKLKPNLKIDMFVMHHNGVKKLRVYDAK